MSLKRDKLVPQQPLVHHLQASTKDKGKVVDQLPIVREQNMQIDQEMESITQHKLPQELDVENPQVLVAKLPQQTDGHERVTAKKRKRGRTMKQGIHVRGLEDPLEKDKEKVVDQLPIEREQNMQIDQEIELTIQHKLPQELDVENPQELVAKLPQQKDGHERVTAKKQKRDRTMKQGIHVRGLEDRDSITVNPYFQPVGPDEKIITDFSEFLGTVARMSNLCPLNLEKWTDMDKFYKGAKERIWEYVKKRWIVPESIRKWVLQIVGADWRTFKCRLKNKHYKPYKNNKMRWKNCPTDVSAEHFKWLLKKWDDTKDKKNANEDNKEPTSVKMFKATRERVIGRVYKAPIEDTQNKIVQMEALQSQQCEENVESVDPFVAVLGNEHRVRLYGRGVTSSSIRKTSNGNGSGGNSASVNVPDELLQKLTAQVTEQVTTVLADKFSLTMAYHLKQISPQYNVDPEALKRLLLTPGDASSAQIHQSPHVNTSSSVNANEASNQVIF
ncbi:hypothetical protein Dimus_020243 [Dionaea muscipula]